MTLGFLLSSRFLFDFSALFSEAWRDELKELAARINRASQAQVKKQEVEPTPDHLQLTLMMQLWWKPS